MANADEQILLSNPPRERVAKAIAESRDRDSGKETKVMKVLYLDEVGNSVGEWASTQIPENPWDGQSTAGLQEPPYNMAQLVYLAEMHPVHSSALDQKAADICGKGWEWEAIDENAAKETDREDMEEWFQSLSPDDVDMAEVIQAAWLDVETIGWGLIECTRDPQGVLKRVYHVPGHTVRAHRDGFRLCQVRDSRKVWFRRWGATDIAGARVDVNVSTGSLTTVPEDKVANDMFVIKRPSRRSTWYGIPTYVSAIGWVTLALAARDDNLMFFNNRREPRWAIILTNLSENADLEEDIRRAFTVDLKQPYRNIVVPITGPGKVDFQKLSDTAKDGSFDKLSERADRAIMIAHRVPAERLANAQVGPLGGNATAANNGIYKDAVVGPGQELLDSRLNRLIVAEWAITKGKDPANFKPLWKLKMDDLDISSEREDLDLVVIAFHGDLITLREARHRLKLGPLMKPAPTPEQQIDPVTGQPIPADDDTPAPVDPETGDPITAEDVESEFNDMIFSQLPGAGPPGPNAGGAPPAGTGRLTGPISQSRDAWERVHARDRDPALALLDADVRELLTSSREVHERLTEMAEVERARPAEE